MKLSFVTARWDPKDPDSGAGVNYNVYQTLKDRLDEIKIVGPFQSQPTLLERAIEKLAGRFTRKRLIKFYPSYLSNSNRAVTKSLVEFQPDVIFSKASIPLVNVDLNAPLVYMCDSTVKWTKKNWPHFSKLGFWLMERWERKVINKASHIITFSEANKSILTDEYHKPKKQITVHPIPSSLPNEKCVYQKKEVGNGQPLHLLLVGKTFQGKGVDIAIETVRSLNTQGIPSRLKVVGQDGVSSETVHFMGYYSKNEPGSLEQYLSHYRWAHFLIFPSRFDAAGIVPSEAAGFGVPTITNAAGGLGTTVQNGVSGIVLEKNSPANKYTESLAYYYGNPQKYTALCQTTYQRYLSALNWDVLGDRLFEIIQSVVAENTSAEKIIDVK